MCGALGSRSGSVSRLFAVSVVWLSVQQLLTRYAALALPRTVARELSLELYLLVVQLIVLGLGVFAARLMLGATFRRELGLRPPGTEALTLGLLLTPLLFVVASYVAVYLALPTLLEELRSGGADRVRQNAGGVGRAMTAAPWLVVLLWGVVVAPVGEELLFRGAVWRLVVRITHAVWPQRARPESLPSELLQESWLIQCSRRVGSWLHQGGVATVVAGVGFGLLHWDLPGGQGVIRLTASTCLGLAAGVARQWSGSVLVPIAVHGVFNLLGLAGARRWIVSETFPTHFMVPTLATLLAGVGGVVALVIAVALRHRARVRPCSTP